MYSCTIGIVKRTLNNTSDLVTIILCIISTADIANISLLRSGYAMHIKKVDQNTFTINFKLYGFI